MSGLIHLFALAALVAAALAGITVWAPRKVWIKAGAIAVAALFIPLAFAGLSDLLSKPKPAHMEWQYRDLAEATVIAATLREDVAIYLWLRIDGVDEPRAYVLPWDRRAAEALQDATREAEDGDGEVRMMLPFETARDEREALFYALPQEMPPAKDPAPNGPLVYNHPSD